MSSVVLLGDILEKIIDYRGKTPIKLGGNWTNHGYRALSAKNIKDGNIKDEKSIRFVDDIVYKKWMKEEIKYGDVLLTSEAPLGEALQWNSNEKIVLSQRLFALRADNSKITSDFLYAYISSPVFQRELERRATGSTVNGIRQSQLIKTQLKLPDFGIQEFIGAFVRNVDEKIDLNQKMNETLEQLGQALFRHYFITNAAASWATGAVSDLVEIYSGLAFKSTDFNAQGQYGLVTIKNVQDGTFITECTDRIDDQLPQKVPDYAHLISGDIILSLTGNVGRVCMVVGNNYLLNQRVAKLKGKDNYNAYTYFLFRSKEMKERLFGISRGTAQMNLSPVETKKLKLALPPALVMADFDNVSRNILEKIIKNNGEIQTLTTLRDILLPRLISGKIKV